MAKTPASYPEPPGYLMRLLRWFCADIYLEEVEGDLFELFQEEVEVYGLKKARRRFFFTAIRYLKPFFFGKKETGLNLTYHLTMLAHYFKISMRSFRRNALYTFINGFGLFLGILVSVLILLWAYDEWQVDRFHPDTDRMYRAYFNGVSEEGEITFTQGSSPYALYKKLMETPGVEDALFFDVRNPAVRKFEDKLLKEGGAWATPSLFKLFDFPMLMGGVENTVGHDQSIFLSEDLAHRIYGGSLSDTLIGSTLLMNDETNYKVAGIFKNIGKNSSFHFDYIINAHFLKMAIGGGWEDNWGAKQATVIAKLYEGTSAEKVEDLINPYYATTDGYGIGGEALMLFPFEKNYLWTKFEQGKAISGRIQYVRIFIGAGIFLLLIACINFINLSTAQATRRGKEVGVRKTVGALNQNLIRQFLTEAGLLIFLVLMAVMICVGVCVPELNAVSNKAISINWTSPIFIIGMIAFGLTLTLLSGLYPAFVLARFKPTSVLKGQVSMRVRKDYLRRMLVVFQFVLSGILIISTLTVRNQLHLIQHENLGLDRNNVISMGLNGPVYEHFEVIRDRLFQYGDVAEIARTSGPPVDLDWIGTRYTWEGQIPDDNNYFYLLNTEDSFDDVFQIEMKEGRFFDRDIQSDADGIVINEKALDFIQMEDPVGKPIRDINGDSWTILGIAKNFNFRSIHNEIEPLIMHYRPTRTGLMYLKVKDGRTTEVIAQLRTLWKEVVPGYPLEFEFVDDAYAKLYEGELLVGKISYFFAAIAIIVSCLGLFGLVTFIALQKTKEIGIRKVLGASVANIVVLLSRNFLQLVLLSLLLAIPVSWYLLNGWLENFAFRVDLGWPIFVLAALMAILVALFTVSFQAIRAALANPVQALRSE
ncbi:MAG: ABC transporter permease [Saprospiraceae bacterium]|nr:ABC transporter permease [Saprospiraceae bacterium]